jgi:stage V sporulation protein SpoVS
MIETMRVAVTTDPCQLAGAIAKVIREGSDVALATIGNRTAGLAAVALGVAGAYLRTEKIALGISIEEVQVQLPTHPEPRQGLMFTARRRILKSSQGEAE